MLRTERTANVACSMMGVDEVATPEPDTSIRRMNETRGFWATYGFLHTVYGQLWPREYRWKCGCKGVSNDGVWISPESCPSHMPKRQRRA